MSCPTCDHTMQSIGYVQNRRVFWCPRCGTLRYAAAIADHIPHDEVPKLVERCRQFERAFPPGNPPSVSFSDEWRRLGIAEAINTPENRPS